MEAMCTGLEPCESQMAPFGRRMAPYGSRVCCMGATFTKPELQALSESQMAPYGSHMQLMRTI
jgi:hypothetical protein